MIFIKKYGIVHETAVPYSPEMNGKTKRNNRTLTKLVAIMMNSGDATH